MSKLSRLATGELIEPSRSDEVLRPGPRGRAGEDHVVAAGRVRPGPTRAHADALGAPERRVALRGHRVRRADLHFSLTKCIFLAYKSVAYLSRLLAIISYQLALY